MDDQQPPPVQEHTPRLNQILAIPDIAQLHEQFVLADKLQPDQLRQLLVQCGIAFTEQQFRDVFMRINTNRDQLCDWDEFISHLLNGFRDDDPYGQTESLQLPIVDAPVLRRSQHRFQIVRIRFCPTVLPDRTVDNNGGNYMTTSKDGTVVYWTQDMVMQRTAKSKNPNLKVSKTWVTDCIPLPDVNIVCTSSIERDLRFYDTTAQNFHPRIIITRMPFAVTCMAYAFGRGKDFHCRLICGDAGGNLSLFEFNARQRGPFEIKPGATLRQVTWADMLLGRGLSGIRVTRLAAVHRDVVRQVEYSAALNAIYSAAECRTIELGRTAAPGLVISELGVQRGQTVFRMAKGVTCFAFDATNTTIATGGPDSMLRLWNHITPNKPQAILPGHHCGITYIFLQDGARCIYTIDHSRCVKVWDRAEQKLLQTYIAIGTALHADRTPYTALYNDSTRELLLAGMRLVTVRCRPLVKLDLTDGQTHARPVSVCLYNELFRTVVTCGFESIIIVWDPLTGRRRLVIRQAHTRMAHGELLRVEITDGCFDPQQQLLLTGARDGTLKVWNFNSGVCVRNLRLEPMCEVTSVRWLPERILAVGWNRHVTEFADTEENVFGEGGKLWDVLHTDDVLATAVGAPLAMATGSCAGELVLWKLETGQPYRRIDVDNPTIPVKITYVGAKVTLAAPVSKYEQSKSKNMAMMRRSFRSRLSIRADRKDADMPTVFSRTKQARSQTRERQRQLSVIQLPSASSLMAKTSIHAMLFLRTRPMDDRHATLVVALSNGSIQMYTHHPLAVPPFKASFNAIHMAGDAVTAMTTDPAERYLIVGTSLGYIKTWLICNYCIPTAEQVHINMPALRVQFPFMIRDLWRGRAKSTSDGNPLLVNSFKAHTLSVTCLVYMEANKLMLSSSADYTTRMWTLGGRYIGTFGSPIGWQTLHPAEPPDVDYPFRMPPDIKRVASSTTLKVFRGGLQDDPLAALLVAARRRARELEVEVRPGVALKVYGKPLDEPMLGTNLRLPPPEASVPNYVLDMSMHTVPIHSHLKYTPAELLEIPQEPFLLTKYKGQQCLAGGSHAADTSDDDDDDDDDDALDRASD